MDIFENLAQQVRFAFAYEPYRDSRALVMVRHALHEAGVGGAIGLQDLLPERLGELRDEAQHTLRAVHALLRVESAALTATFSRDWDERRAAVQVLTPHFRQLLARLVDNPRLADKLVARHYIAQRERGHGWGIDDLSNEFKIPASRLTRATHALDHCARELEKHALKCLREALGLPDARPVVKSKTAEVAHV